MKQLKFLMNVSCDGKLVWYKDCCYEVISEGANAQGREMYKLFCEDLQLRGIDTALADRFYKVIEIEDKQIKVLEKEQKKIELVEEDKKEEIKPVPKSKSAKKKKSTK